MLYDLVTLTVSISVVTWLVLLTIYHVAITSFLKGLVGISQSSIWLRLIWFQSFVVSVFFGVRPWGLDKYAMNDVSLILNNNKMVYEGVQALMWSLISTSTFLMILSIFIVIISARVSRKHQSGRETVGLPDDYQIPLL